MICFIVVFFRQCWECLGEAYKGRGSHLAALKAFTKALQVRYEDRRYTDKTLYCLPL